jgi:hypothetical protein
MFQKDLLPSIEMTLKDRRGLAVDLTDAQSVKLYIADDAGTKIVDAQDITVVDSEKGLCRYDWKNPETQTVGSFTAQVVVVFASGKPQTAGKFSLVIEQSLY